MIMFGSKTKLKYSQFLVQKLNQNLLNLFSKTGTKLKGFTYKTITI